jgi:dolichol-phosphate mannosyltransferase
LSDDAGPVFRKTFSESGCGALELSVVVPLFNEAPCVGEVFAELRGVLGGLAASAEVIAVDDGSTDGTAAQLERIARDWSALRVERLPGRRGQAAALWRGFELARGRWIATLDGDGQNPPVELARLWALRHTGDMVAGRRIDRQDSWLRRHMSRLANAVRQRLLHDGVRDAGCSLKLFRRELVRDFLPIRTLYSFLPAFAVAAGRRVVEVPVAHRPRRAGESKYGLQAMAILPLLDLLRLWWFFRRRVGDGRRR